MIWFLTHADTELLGLRVIAESLPDGFPLVRAANPAALEGPPDIDGTRLVIVRLFGGRQGWAHFDDLVAVCRAKGVPLLCFGGEAVPDAELMAASSVPGGIVTQAFDYLVQGGTANLEQMLRFVADTVLGEGFGFKPPSVIPSAGFFGASEPVPGRPSVGIVFYRAHVLAGNTMFVDDLCAAIEARRANAVPVYCYSLRDSSDVVGLLASSGVGAVVTTVLAAGSFAPGSESAASAEHWAGGALAGLGVPILQGIVSTSSSAAWLGSHAGLSSLDVAWQVALPELDGRVIAVPFSFKEVVDDGDELGAGVGLPDRARQDRPSRRARRAPGVASLAAASGAEGGDRSLRLPHEALATRQRRRPRHTGVGHRSAACPQRRRLPGGPHSG